MQGSAMSFCQDGIRLLPVEVNALVTVSAYNNPQRQFSGMDTGRAKILIAALGKYANMMDEMATCDVFANTINGMRLTDTMADLAVIAAIASSALGIEPLQRTVWIGEVALTGRIRGRAMIESRLREAQRLGFERVVIPKAAKIKKSDYTGLKIDIIDSVSEIKKLL